MVVIAVLNTLVSFYYYFRIIVNMYMSDEKGSLRPDSGLLTAGLIALLVTVVFILGIAPGYLLDITVDIARSGS